MEHHRTILVPLDLKLEDVDKVGSPREFLGGETYSCYIRYDFTCTAWRTTSLLKSAKKGKQGTNDFKKKISTQSNVMKSTLSTNSFMGKKKWPSVFMSGYTQKYKAFNVSTK
jgi:hypothetical protein